ncbi:hypothetical protein H4R19_003130 [Coemansia spiralis]|nr:hypothetical protein H4R19_003130 [Coemansia spiralis]
MHVEEALDNCIVSLSEWQRLYELLRQHPDWTPVSDVLLFAVAIIECPQRLGPRAQAASNIPLILGRGAAEGVRFLIVHSGEAQVGQSSESLYRELEAAIYSFTCPLHRPPHPPLGRATLPVLVGRVVEAARTAMPNVAALVVTRTQLLGGVQPQATSRHVRYCVAMATPTVASGLCAAPPLAVTHGHSRYIVPWLREIPSLLPMRLSALLYLYQKPLPVAFLHELAETIGRHEGACLPHMPGAATTRTRHHVHFCPNRRFTDLVGNICAFDWCKVIVSEPFN